MSALFVPADIKVLQHRIQAMTEWMKHQDLDLCLVTAPTLRRYLID